MFEDFYVRVPFPRLQAEAELLRREGLAPEVAFGNPTLVDFGPAEFRQAGRQLRRFSSHTLHAPFIDILPGSLDAEVRGVAFDKLRRVMELAADWGSRLVVMHANYDPIYYRHHPAAWVERAADFYVRLLETAGSGTLIAVENIADPLPDILLRLSAAVNHPRLIHCFDFGHHRVFARIPFPEWLARLQPCPALHFHLHDNGGADDDHLPLGQGIIDWGEAKRVLAGLACPFTVALEPHTPENRSATVGYYRRHFLDRADA